MKLFTLLLILCLQSELGIAQESCSEKIMKISAETDHEVLERAYSQFIEEQNQNLQDIPKVIPFKNQELKVIEILGKGLEGVAIRVEDSVGKRSIVKIFISPLRSLPIQIWNYYRMNSKAKHPYSVIGIDFKRQIFMFKDMRGIPMNNIDKILRKVNAPQSLITKIYQKVAMVGYEYAEQNTVYDIDQGVFIAIDPH